MKRHNLDVLSLVFGLVFVAIATVGLLDQLTVSWSDIRWLVPTGLVAAGLALVITAGRSGRARRAADEADRADQASAQVSN